MATTIPRTPWIDDDGSGTTGTVLNNAIKTELYDQIDVALANVGTAAGTEVIASASAVVTLNPAYRNHEVRFYGTVLHGFTKTGAQEGDEVLVVNSTGLGPIELAHDSVTATTSTDRLWNVATSANTRVTSNGSARYVRDYKTEGASGGNDRWRMVAHEQGAWITPAFNAADFVNWTVPAGSVTTSKYVLRGRTLTYAYLITSFTCGVVAQLIIANGQWGGFTGVGTMTTATGYASDASLTGPAWAQIAGGTQLIFSRYGANWAATTNAGTIQGVITFEVS